MLRRRKISPRSRRCEPIDPRLSQKKTAKWNGTVSTISWNRPFCQETVSFFHILFPSKRCLSLRYSIAGVNDDDCELYMDIDKLAKDHMSVDPSDSGRSLKRRSNFDDSQNGGSKKKVTGEPLTGKSNASSRIKVSAGASGMPCSSELNRSLLWNRQMAFLPNAHLKFERNEFGMVELRDTLSDDEGEPRSSCGHGDLKDCFDSIIDRIEGPRVLGQSKKPHEYHSKEYRELIRIAIKNRKGDCSAVMRADVKAAKSSSATFRLNDVEEAFTWSSYFRGVASANDGAVNQSEQAAPVQLFFNPFPSSINRFSAGQKLEAIDPQNCSLFCVCTIVETCGYRIKLHFDGYPSAYDFWLNADSMDIFPPGWCAKTARELQPPSRRNLCGRAPAFNWMTYLTASKAKAAPRECFTHLNSSVRVKNRSSQRTSLRKSLFSRRQLIRTLSKLA